VKNPFKDIMLLGGGGLTSAATHLNDLVSTVMTSPVVVNNPYIAGSIELAAALGMQAGLVLLDDNKKKQHLARV
jgi:hypothetical protein